MASINFNTSNETLRKLLGNGLTYRIPSFQRDYSWTQTEWEDLWEDVVALFGPEPESGHYMGYLVLQSSDSKAHDVIDGQQRLTTLSIIILAGIALLQELSKKGTPDADLDRRRGEQLRNSYIGYQDPISLVAHSKLTLNRHNDRFYQTYIVPLERMPQRGLHASEHALRKGFEWFQKKMGDYTKGSGEAVARLIDGIVDKLFFTVITVTDELNAFKVFETLNARGVRLSSTDLLKNYLFSLVSREAPHEHELKTMEDRWARISETIGAESLPDFLRIFWNGRYRVVRRADLFKTLRSHVKNRQEAFELVRELDSSADIYAMLRQPSDEHWTKEERKHLQELQMYSVRQPLPLLLSAYIRLSGEHRDLFGKILRAISVISFRYNVICNLQASEQESLYNQVAQDVFSEKLKTRSEIFAALKSAYPDDEMFGTHFENKELSTINSRNKKIVRYILHAIENKENGSDLDFESDRTTIEHIAPENPEESAWDEELTASVYRLGNMILLNATQNKDLGNAPYAQKRAIYEKSDYSLTRYVAEHYDAWTSDKVKSFQKHLAKQAKSIWRIDF